MSIKCKIILKLRVTQVLKDFNRLDIDLEKKDF